MVKALLQRDFDPQVWVINALLRRFDHLDYSSTTLAHAFRQVLFGSLESDTSLKHVVVMLATVLSKLQLHHCILPNGHCL